jgi:AraC-like DNA-binding protein
MPRPDRHNEIEINLLTGGSLTYLINDSKVTVPSKRLAIFWALIPHQIVHFSSNAPYFVCTIPFTQFMNWHLPSSMVDFVLKGNVLNATTDRDYDYDYYLMDNWLNDVTVGDSRHVKVAEMEMCARLHRFALHSIPAEWDGSDNRDDTCSMIDLVEKMIIFIARHYKQSIKNKDIGEAVGLHPDYANTLFKKSFGMTLNQYVVQQRILYVQRQLSVSNDSITQIAYDAGFNSPSRFNTAFREKCKCSPSEYRKRYSSNL